jgi:hypothetical protein
MLLKKGACTIARRRPEFGHTRGRRNEIRGNYNTSAQGSCGRQEANKLALQSTVGSC